MYEKELSSNSKSKSDSQQFLMFYSDEIDKIVFFFSLLTPMEPNIAGQNAANEHLHQ